MRNLCRVQCMLFVWPFLDKTENCLQFVEKIKVYIGDGWPRDSRQTHFDQYFLPDFYTWARIARVSADFDEEDVGGVHPRPDTPDDFLAPCGGAWVCHVREGRLRWPEVFLCRSFSHGPTRWRSATARWTREGHREGAQTCSILYDPCG